MPNHVEINHARSLGIGRDSPVYVTCTFDSSWSCARKPVSSWPTVFFVIAITSGSVRGLKISQGKPCVRVAAVETAASVIARNGCIEFVHLRLAGFCFCSRNVLPTSTYFVVTFMLGQHSGSLGP